MKAIRKTRKSAVICIHTDESDQAGQPTEQLPEGETTPEEEGAHPPETPPETRNPPAETTRTEAAAPPAEAPDEPSQLENPPPATSQPHQPRRQKDDGVHIVYHHPPDHGYYHPHGPNPQQGYGGQWNTYHGGSGFRVEPYQPPQPVYVQSYNTYRPSPHVTEYAYPRSPPRYSFHSRPDHYSGLEFRGEPPQPPQPVYATHSYNTYKPSPYVTGYAHPQSPPKDSPYSRPDYYSDPGFRGEPSQPPQPLYATHNYNMYKPSPYVTEYAYPESPPRYSSYSIPDHYSRDYNSGNYENGNVTSMFSEENPNACRIV